jgi:tRNA-2-methylthio-N6-dimethylallyladenosine synthase
MDLQSEISREKNKELMDKVVEVFGEGESKNDPEKQMGRTRTNKIVIFDSKSDLTGELINVKINRTTSWTLFGDLVN